MQRTIPPVTSRSSATSAGGENGAWTNGPQTAPQAPKEKKPNATRKAKGGTRRQNDSVREAMRSQPLKSGRPITATTARGDNGAQTLGPPNGTAPWLPPFCPPPSPHRRPAGLGKPPSGSTGRIPPPSRGTGKPLVLSATPATRRTRAREAGQGRQRENARFRIAPHTRTSSHVCARGGGQQPAPQPLPRPTRSPRAPSGRRKATEDERGFHTAFIPIGRIQILRTASRQVGRR